MPDSTKDSFLSKNVSHALKTFLSFFFPLFFISTNMIWAPKLIEAQCVRRHICRFSTFFCRLFPPAVSSNLDFAQRTMSDKQPNCRIRSSRGGGTFWNNDHVEIPVITSPVTVPEAPLTLGSVCQFSILWPEQNNKRTLYF